MKIYCFSSFAESPTCFTNVKAKLKLASHESPNQLAVLALTFLLAAIQASFWQSLPQKKTCRSILKALTNSPKKNPEQKNGSCEDVKKSSGEFLGGANCWRHPIRHLRLEFHHLAKLLYFTSLDFPEIQDFPAKKLPKLGAVVFSVAMTMNLSNSSWHHYIAAFDPTAQKP